MLSGKQFCCATFSTELTSSLKNINPKLRDV